MCGIIAGVSYRNILRVLSSGLKKVEYRGYDSCGIAMLENSKLTRYRTVSRVEMLEQEILKHPDLPLILVGQHTVRLKSEILILTFHMMNSQSYITVSLRILKKLSDNLFKRAISSKAILIHKLSYT